MSNVVKLFLLIPVLSIIFSGCNSKPQYVNVSGTVIDAGNGQPVPNVNVRVLSFYSPKDISTDADTKTDGNGQFVINHFKMAYKEPSFKKQKSSTIKIIAWSSDYTSNTQPEITLPINTISFDKVVYVDCYAKGDFSVAVNSGITFDLGVVNYKRYNSNYSEYITVAGPSSGAGVYGFYPTDVPFFTQKIWSGSNYRNVFTTTLYYNGVAVKTQVDTITGQACKGSFTYTINVN